MCWLASRYVTCTFPGHWYIACSGCKVLASLALLFFALLALGPLPVMLADGCPAALLALRPLPVMLADGCPATLLALRSPPPMLVDGCPAVLLVHRSHPTMLTVPWLSIPDSRYRCLNVSSLIRYFLPLVRSNLATDLPETNSARWSANHCRRWQ